MLIYAAKRASDIKVTLQQDLTLLYNWLKLSQLYLNVKKTKWNLIGLIKS